MDRSAGSCSLNVLKARFFELWKRRSSAGNEADPTAIWAGLIESYNEPWRNYHTADHLCHCLQQLDLAAALMEDPAAVEIALWFHDIILRPDAPNNEAKSAERFAQTTGKHFQADFVDKVSQLILATMHRKLPPDRDARYLCDIDLSSLGSPWEQFLKDSTAIRTEQSEMPDEQFYPAKIRFFKSLLERPAIFLTDFFQSRYEHAARENIQRYIKQTEAHGDC